jgi:hypothetical protein
MFDFSRRAASSGAYHYDHPSGIGGLVARTANGSTFSSLKIFTWVSTLLAKTPRHEFLHVHQAAAEVLAAAQNTGVLMRPGGACLRARVPWIDHRRLGPATVVDCISRIDRGLRARVRRPERRKGSDAEVQRSDPGLNRGLRAPVKSADKVL